MSNVRLTEVFFIIICTFMFLNGCLFSQYPPIKKDLFSRQIPKNSIDTLKGAILENGYTRLSDENYPYEGAIVTQYGKDIIVSQMKNEINITLSFKEYKENESFYSNLGLQVASFNKNYFQETYREVNKIEQILYSKLIEICGENNVVRGERKNKSPDFKWRFGP